MSENLTLFPAVPGSADERNQQEAALMKALRSPAPCYGRAVDEALAFVADKFRCTRRKGSDTPT